jgi:hypothetical protein
MSWVLFSSYPCNSVNPPYWLPWVLSHQIHWRNLPPPMIVRLPHATTLYRLEKWTLGCNSWLPPWKNYENSISFEVWLEHLQRCSACEWPCKNNSHIQVLVTCFFPTVPPIKLKLGLQMNRWVQNTNSNPPQGPIKVYAQWTAAGGVRFCCAFLPASANYAQMLGQ